MSSERTQQAHESSRNVPQKTRVRLSPRDVSRLTSAIKIFRAPLSKPAAFTDSLDEVRKVAEVLCKQLPKTDVAAQIAKDLVRAVGDYFEARKVSDHDAARDVTLKDIVTNAGHLDKLLSPPDTTYSRKVINYTTKSGGAAIVPGAKEEGRRKPEESAVGEELQALEPPPAPPTFRGKLLSDCPQEAVDFLTAKLEESGNREVREALGKYLKYISLRFKIPHGPRPKGKVVEDIRDAVDDLESFLVDLHNLALRVGRSLAINDEPVTLHVEQDGRITAQAGRAQPFKGRSFPSLGLSE